MHYIINAFSTIFSPMGLLLNIVGVALGIIFGALPGLNGVVGVALLLPLTYNMNPSFGLIMLAGLYMGATYGGLISAILLNCPGTGEAACTALNGNPMARQGSAQLCHPFQWNRWIVWSHHYAPLYPGFSQVRIEIRAR